MTLLSVLCTTVLNVALLVRHPKTEKLVVNFDPKVTEVIREAKCLVKMDLLVPKQALHLLSIETKLSADHHRLQASNNYFFSQNDYLT